MTSTDNDHYEIARNKQGPAAYEHWAAGAASRPPALERAALLAMVRQDLVTGTRRRSRPGPAVDRLCAEQPDLDHIPS